MTYRQLVDNTIALLVAAGIESREARWIARAILEDLGHTSMTDVVVRADHPVTDWLRDTVTAAARRVAAGEPVQYVTGIAPFYGMEIHVTPDVLIPRPETAELVDMIVEDAGGKPDLRILDIATGSGCIAIALARNIPFARVSAVDISVRALDVAAANAGRLRAKVDFRPLDILHAPAPEAASQDIIVSNPPYICNSERATMEPSVVDHEPGIALFVPDDDPLLFYNAINRYAAVALVEGGRLYYEINPLHADALVAAMTAAGWADVAVTLDTHGRRRFITATRSDETTA